MLLMHFAYRFWKKIIFCQGFGIPSAQFRAASVHIIPASTEEIRTVCISFKESLKPLKLPDTWENSVCQCVLLVGDCFWWLASCQLAVQTIVNRTVLWLRNLGYPGTGDTLQNECRSKVSFPNKHLKTTSCLVPVNMKNWPWHKSLLCK